MIFLRLAALILLAADPSSFIRTPSIVLRQSADERFARAVALQREERLAEAEAEYRGLLDLDPGHAQARANLGALLMRLDRYEEAVGFYESALNLSPTLTPIILNLGIAHYKKSAYEKAVEAFRRFLETFPEHLQALQLLGLSLLQLERYPDAAEVFRRALTRAPDSPDALYGLGISDFRMNGTDPREIIGKLRRTPAGAAAAHLLQGQILMERSDHGRALPELEAASRLNPDLPRVSYLLALAYTKSGRNDDAVAALEALLTRAPADFQSLFLLAYLHEIAGDLEAARARLDQARSIAPHSTEAANLDARVESRRARAIAWSRDAYLGSSSCVPCHQLQARKQLSSNMAKAAFAPREHPLFERFRDKAARILGFRYLFVHERGSFDLAVLDETRELRAPVQWALGAGVHGVTFFSRIEKGKYLESSLSYYPKADRLDFTPGQGEHPFKSLEEAAGHANDRSDAFRCLGCHTTGTGNRASDEDIAVGELGVRCEACHGPGKRHVEAVKSSDWTAARSRILNPGRESARRMLEDCGVCHREPPLDPAQVNWRDPANARFQPVGLSQSLCFLESEGKLTCTTCHDAHSDTRRNDPAFYADVCAGCHTPTQRAPAAACKLEREPDCVSCHMPRVEAIRHMDFANHWIGVYSEANKLVPVRASR